MMPHKKNGKVITMNDTRYLFLKLTRCETVNHNSDGLISDEHIQIRQVKKLRESDDMSDFPMNSERPKTSTFRRQNQLPPVNHKLDEILSIWEMWKAYRRG